VTAPSKQLLLPKQMKRKVPSVSEVLADPCVSYWLKNTLRTAMERDCVDALYDVQLLEKVFTANFNKVMGKRP
jgi:hypothetical protein